MENIFDTILNSTPDIKKIPQFNPNGEFDNIEAITFDGAPIGDKKTKVFAYIGYPENINGKVPAIVLVHGGGGTPYLPWVKLWNEHGYAAIAMSTTGDFPVTVNAGATSSTFNDEWHHGLCSDFKELGYTDAPANDHMEHSHEAIDKQWMYHAISQVIASHNIFRNDERVDCKKIGIMGLSWGGVITSLTTGYDNRFAFAIPVFGSGYLAESMGTLGKFFRSGENKKLWLAESNFDNVTIPVLWQCMNNDTPFSANSNSKSYIDTRRTNSQTRLSIVEGMRHSYEDASVRPEPFMFADLVCKNQKRMPEIWENEIKNDDDAKIRSLRVFYIDAPMSYSQTDDGGVVMDQKWHYKDLDSLNDPLPDEAVEYYFELTSEIDNKLCITTSQIFRKD